MRVTLFPYLVYSMLRKWPLIIMILFLRIGIFLSYIELRLSHNLPKLVTRLAFLLLLVV